jgi:hypothetical protein
MEGDETENNCGQDNRSTGAEDKSGTAVASRAGYQEGKVNNVPWLGNVGKNTESEYPKS